MSSASHSSTSCVPLAVFASGTGTNFRAILEAYADGRLGAAVPQVLITNRACPATAIADEYHIPSVTLTQNAFPNKDSWEEAIVAELRSRDVELIALAGYLRIVGAPLLAAYPNRIINLHPALLPAYRGLHSIERIFTDSRSTDSQLRAAAQAASGVTVHWVDSGLDSGPVIAQQAVEVDRFPSLDSFEAAIHAVEHQLFPATIAQVSTGILHSHTLHPE
ncbi:MAG: phosphoribosylglycinamide formyltransferase [Actinomycetaceae bacterium]|nr:phosphoribosylglycinamide formyltransferase [Arcanobacterium sp.]MDD7504331.1 phosphoribosylglycinamide formyltransferase [Actinomycetaceae bacterium]MDY6143920.1 phosphoribosylglycinamide formyltransferase [Arcanobacterium sp.]